MKHVGRLAVVIAALTLMLVPAAASAALASPSRQVVRVRMTSTRPATATGVVVSATYTSPPGSGGHPYSLRRVIDGLPPGTAIQTASVPSCAASVIELMVLGPGVCPRASIVGSGTVQLDLGLPGALGAVTTDLSLINAGGQILFLGRESRTGIGLVDKGTIDGSSIDIPIPALPGLGPEGAWVSSETFTIPASSGLLVSPATCPPSRQWTFHRTHTYADGVTQTVAVPLRCAPARPSRSPAQKSRG